MNKFTNNDPNQNQINENMSYRPNLSNQKVFPQEKNSDYVPYQNGIAPENNGEIKDANTQSISDKIDEAFKQGLADGSRDRFTQPLQERDNQSDKPENLNSSFDGQKAIYNPPVQNTPNYNPVNDISNNNAANIPLQKSDFSADTPQIPSGRDNSFAHSNQNQHAYHQGNQPNYSTPTASNGVNPNFAQPAQTPQARPQIVPQGYPVQNQPYQNGHPYSQNSYAPNQTGLNNTPEKPKKSNKKLVILIVVILVVLALLITSFCAAIAFFVSDNSPKGSSGDKDSLNSQSSNSDAWGIDSEDITDPNNSGLEINDQPEINVNEYSAQAAYEALSKSVVGIQCFEKGLQEVNEGPAGEGTGIIVDKAGYIVTNSHVIGDSKSLYDVYVSLGDDEQFEARIVGFDAKTDLAVLKIKTDKELTPATFADSEQVSVGQDVIALGNPGGSEYSNSLTKGIISAVNRSVSTYSYVNYIQTDAAINPGNSGGPLANLYGQVIGINTIKIVDEEYEGMGFAIPSNTVKKICDDLITLGYVSNRVRIGITGQEISSAMASSYNVPGGILIVGFSSDSPFKGTDAKENDIITAFDGEEIHSFSELYKELDKHSPGDEVTVTLYRQDSNQKGKTFDVKIKLLADLGETQVTE